MLPTRIYGRNYKKEKKSFDEPFISHYLSIYHDLLGYYLDNGPGSGSPGRQELILT